MTPNPHAPAPTRTESARTHTSRIPLRGGGPCGRTPPAHNNDPADGAPCSQKVAAGDAYQTGNRTQTTTTEDARRYFLAVLLNRRRCCAKPGQTRCTTLRALCDHCAGESARPTPAPDSLDRAGLLTINTHMKDYLLAPPLRAVAGHLCARGNEWLARIRRCSVCHMAQGAC